MNKQHILEMPKKYWSTERAEYDTMRASASIINKYLMQHYEGKNVVFRFINAEICNDNSGLVLEQFCNKIEETGWDRLDTRSVEKKQGRGYKRKGTEDIEIYGLKHLVDENIEKSTLYKCLSIFKEKDEEHDLEYVPRNILLIYDAEQMEQVPYTRVKKDKISQRKDGWKFKGDKKEALLKVIKLI